MPIFQQQTRAELREMYVEAWRKRREKLPLEPLEAQIAEVVEQHPEYQAGLNDAGRLADRDYIPEGGESNPFLHMGLHLAVRDQIATDRPRGIRAAFGSLVKRTASSHDAEHVLIELLAEALWNAQRVGQPPDEHAYLERIRARIR